MAPVTGAQGGELWCGGRTAGQDSCWQDSNINAAGHWLCPRQASSPGCAQLLLMENKEFDIGSWNNGLWGYLQFWGILVSASLGSQGCEFCLLWVTSVAEKFCCEAYAFCHCDAQGEGKILAQMLRCFCKLILIFWYILFFLKF